MEKTLDVILKKVISKLIYALYLNFLNSLFF